MLTCKLVFLHYQTIRPFTAFSCKNADLIPAFSCKIADLTPAFSCKIADLILAFS